MPTRTGLKTVTVGILYIAAITNHKQKILPLLMEQINEFIFVHTSNNADILETVCTTTQDYSHIYISYTLLSEDCLFDFSNTLNKVEIKIAKNYFEKYGQSYRYNIKKQNICCNSQSKLYELIHCRCQGIARKIYLESIVLHLLFQMQKGSHSQLHCDNCTFLSQQPLESEKIQSAKDYILSNLEKNITIPMVANHVGTNQCYLKKRFKDAVGQTIFEFLQENRMVKARYLLQNTTHSVQSISLMVGYASISSFSQSYKNYFGLSPSWEQKQSIVL